MKEIHKYALAKTKRYRKVLLKDNLPLPFEVKGELIEIQLEVNQEYDLVWTTDDNSYEEKLHIYLINREGLMEDAVETTAIYTSAVLKILETGNDWVKFRFFTDDTLYFLQINSLSQFCFRTPRNWRYNHFFRKHKLLLKSA